MIFVLIFYKLYYIKSVSIDSITCIYNKSKKLKRISKVCKIYYYLQFNDTSYYSNNFFLFTFFDSHFIVLIHWCTYYYIFSLIKSKIENLSLIQRWKKALIQITIFINSLYSTKNRNKYTQYKIFIINKRSRINFDLCKYEYL